MSHVIYHKEGAVGVVTLSKPPHNLIDEALLDGLLSSCDRAIAEGCRAIRLRSAMRRFCAGADVAGFAGGIPAFQGEHDAEQLAESGVDVAVLADLQERLVLLSRRSPRGAYD